MLKDDANGCNISLSLTDDEGKGEGPFTGEKRGTGIGVKATGVGDSVGPIMGERDRAVDSFVGEQDGCKVDSFDGAADGDEVVGAADGDEVGWLVI
jgi:hypothetical protein